MRHLMTIKTIIFCDTCNQQRVRNVDRRISTDGKRTFGRRLHDGRSSVVFEPGDPMPEGWFCDETERYHVCPLCVERVRNLSSAGALGLGLPKAVLDSIVG